MKTDCQCCRFLLHKYEHGFPSETEFVEMQDNLKQMCEAGEFEFLGPDPSQEAFFHELYRCRHCGYQWRLSIPDHAYRGGLNKMWKT